MDVDYLSDGFEALAQPSALHESLDIECADHRVSAIVDASEPVPA